MALQKTFETRYGLILTDAYIRIIDISFNVTSNGMDISVGIFSDASLANSGKIPVDTWSGQWSSYDKSSTDNAHTQIYKYLKTLDLYSDAIDV